MLEPIELPDSQEHTHTFGEWNFFGGDSCDGGLFFALCDECNEKVEWKLGDENSHKWENAHSFDGEKHWTECERCQEKKNLENHKDVGNDGKCDVCGCDMPEVDEGAPFPPIDLPS